MSKKVDSPSRIGGTVNEILGKIKEKTGKVFGNKSMEAKGHMQREMGNAEVEAAKRKKAQTKADKHMKKGNVTKSDRETFDSTPPSYSNMTETPVTTASEKVAQRTSESIPAPPPPPPML